MDLADKNRFLDALAVVEAVCCDPMDELRLRAYWLVLGPSCTIEEWEQACLDVLTASTFHRVPMPGVFVQALEALRERIKQERGYYRQLAVEEARRDADAQRHMMRTAPDQRAQHDAAMQQCMRQLDKILGDNWRSLADAWAAGDRRTRERHLANFLAETDH